MMRAADDGSVLEAANLSKSWDGIAVVRDVSFTVHAGEMLALIGPNGAGKSTCFDMLTGQTRPDRGQVNILGQAVSGRTPEQISRLGVGRTFQVAATFASMSVLENIQVALLSHAGQLTGLQPRTFTAQATELYRTEAMVLLEAVGMTAQAEKPCGVLAYGDIKRVELAMALTHKPRVLLMDEPTAGMSPSERVQIMRLVSKLAERDQLGVLFTEHDMDTVFGHARRVLVLHRGQLIANGSPDVVRADARVQEVYLGSGALVGETNL
jgi:branched-chain amino acid transport system ATP-binding protein